MEVVRNFCNYSYILAGRKAFFYSFTDSGFKDKWTGFWAMPCKIFDYISIRVGDSWLSPANITRFDYDGKKAVSKFIIDGKTITQSITVPEGKKALMINLEGAKEFFFEIGFNMKKREENWHDREYKIKGNMIESKCGGKCKTKLDGAEINDYYYKDHYPGGERQRCFVVTGKIKKNKLIINNEEGKFSFTADKKEMEEKIFCDNETIQNSFSWMQRNIEMLSHESKYGFGFFAGYPWFTMFWGRDSGWIIPAATRLGMFEESRNALETLAKHSKNRIINYILTDGGIDENSVDAALLWIIALHDYVYNSGDLEFLRRMKDKLNSFMDYYFSNLDENGFPLHDTERPDTWMDTYLRRGAVDIAAMWVRALECYSELLTLLGEENIQKKLADVQREKIEIYWNGSRSYYKDALTSEKITPNALFVLYFNVGDHEKDILKTIESYNLNTDWGIRSLSNTDSEYDPTSYHKGNIWGFLTALAACIELKYGERGMKYLKILCDNISETCLGGTNETWNGDTKRPTGCCMQGWNAALFINAVDDFMIGIKIDAFKDKDVKKCITLEPRLPIGINKIKRKRRIRDKWIEITVERKGDEIITNIG